MSVKVSSAVWEHSQARGTRRLVLLAIADHCQDDGMGAYPSIDSLATKCRLSVRAIYDNINELVELGELEVKTKASRYGTNLYTVKLLQGTNRADPRRESAGTTVQIDDGDLHVNRNEPSVEPSGTKERARQSARRRQISNGYTPSGPMFEWARKNFPTIDAVAETAQFYDYHRARASTMVDWEAAWRTWIRKAEAYAKSGRKGHKPYSDSDEWGVA